jgi:transcriptional regulator GlxA family with amidase domain
MLPRMTALNVAIFIFENAEVLDFCGPFEVFAATRSPADSARPFNVFTVAEHDAPIAARNGLIVYPNHTFASCPQPDILVIPGGYGARQQIRSAHALDWVRSRARHAQIVLSVCTGAFILAKAGLLDGLTATTHHSSFDTLEELAPHTTVVRDQRYVDNGKVITSAGISAGIDASLYVVARLLGAEQARWTAQHMEYRWEEG